MRGTVEYYVNGITVMASEKFKFCPMCGRRLDEECIRRKVKTIRSALKL